MGITYSILRKRPRKRPLSSSSSQREQWILGRRRLRQVPNLLPVDPAEMTRCDELFRLHRILLKGQVMTTTQLAEQSKILDIGTGSGLWLKEMALRYPKAKFLGVDLSEDLFNKNGLPSNVKFMVCDVLKGLPINSSKYDFIHLQHLMLAIPTIQWPSLLSEVFRSLRSEGTVELCELYFPPKLEKPLDFIPFCFEKQAFPSFGDLLRAMFSGMEQSASISVDISLFLPQLLEDAGFENIAVHRVPVLLQPLAEHASAEEDFTTQFIKVLAGLAEAAYLVTDGRDLPEHYNSAFSTSSLSVGRCESLKWNSAYSEIDLTKSLNLLNPTETRKYVSNILLEDCSTNTTVEFRHVTAQKPRI